MIRHSSAFFISVIVHLSLIAVIFYIFDVKKENDVKIAIRLCSLEEKKELQEDKEEQKQEALKTKEIKKEQIKNSQKTEQKNDIEEEEEPARQGYECKDIAVVKTEHSKEEPQKAETTKTTTSHYEVKKELPKENPEENYIKINKEEIAALIQENLYYPIVARKKAIEGLVIVRFVIDKSGEASAIEIIESQNEVLSRAAVKTLQNLSNKFPKPSEKIYLTLPIEYRLQK